MSLARTSRLDTVFLIHLLRCSFEEYMEKPTIGYVIVYMFPCSLYIKRICKKGLLSIPGKKKKKCSHSLGLTRGKARED